MAGMGGRFGRQIGRDRRLGWLLRINRLYAHDPAQVNLSHFAQNYRTGAGQAVHPATLSRWERGQSRFTASAVVGYERVLRLRPNALIAISDVVSRYESSSNGAAPLLTRSPVDDVDVRRDRLLDIVHDQGLMSGADWDLLTALLASTPHMALSPTSRWTELAERLLCEMSIADGMHWLPRAEAFNRLMAHPVGHPAAIAAAADAAADRSAQSLVGTVSVFEASATAAANRQVLAHLTNPVTDRTFYGALLACVRKLRHGHFRDPDELIQLAHLFGDLIAEDAGASPLAAALLTIFPVNLRHRVNRRVWQVVAEIARRPVGAADVVRSICERTLCRLPWVIHGFRDPVLSELVSEMLFAPIFDVRLYATFSLYATPYRLPLAAVLAEDLVGAMRRGAVDRSVALLQALRVLGGLTERRSVERLLLAHRVPMGVRDQAAAALGHIGGSSDDRYFRAAIAGAFGRWQHSRSTAEASVLDRLVYALGMADRLALLGQVVVTPGMPQPVRNSAAWWLALPDHIRRSAHGTLPTP